MTFIAGASLRQTSEAFSAFIQKIGEPLGTNIPILAVFFSAVALLIVTIVFQLACPPIIRTHRDFEAFRKHELSSDGEFSKLESDEESSFKDDVKTKIIIEELNIDQDSADRVADIFFDIKKMFQVSKKDQLEERWEKAEIDLPRTRLAASLLLYVSLALFLLAVCWAAFCIVS